MTIINKFRVNQPKPINTNSKKISKQHFDVLAEMEKFDVPMGNDLDGDIEVEDDNESDDDEDDESEEEEEEEELSDIYPDNMKEEDLIKAIKGKNNAKGNSKAQQPVNAKGKGAPKAGNIFGQGKKQAGKGKAKK